MANAAHTDGDCGQWFEQSFSEDYLKVYRHRDFLEAQAAIESLLRLTGLEPGARCLDLACGFGRHLSLLIERGFDAAGLDLSEELLAVAREDAALAGRLIRADMRAFPISDASLDFIFSFFSSFGYFSRDAENLLVLEEMHRALRPGGGFLLDYLNADYLARNFVPSDEKIIDGMTVRQRRYINDDRNMIVKEMKVIDAEGERTYHECVKMYRREDFQRFCELAGFEPVKWWGDYHGAEFTEESERLILWAEKKKAGH